MICKTETCTNEATHIDALTNVPVCRECMESALNFSDRESDFKPIDPVAHAEEQEKAAEQAGDVIQIIEDHVSTPPTDDIKKVDEALEIMATAGEQPTTDTDLLSVNNISALTILEASLAEDLVKIEADASTLPTLAKTETEYSQVYEFSTRLKRFSVACRKKEKLLQDDLKSDFKKSKLAISTQLETIMSTITPLIATTIKSRDYMECWKLGLKMNKARDLAATQEVERVRIAAEKKRIKDEKKTEQDKKDDELKLDREKLERERFEFECDKSRLSVDEAWEYIELRRKKNKTEDQEAIKIGEEYFAGVRPGVSQEELDKILDNEPPSPPYPDSVLVDDNQAEPEPVLEYGPGPGGSCITNEVKTTSEIKTSEEQAPAEQPDPVYDPVRFIVINTKHLKILSDDQLDTFKYLISMMDVGNKYYVCNQDEPYAPSVIKTILEGEKAKLNDESPV